MCPAFSSVFSIEEIMTDIQQTPDSLFELGKLYLDRCEFSEAKKNLILASDLYLDKKDFKSYLNSVNLLLRLYAEADEGESVNLIKEKLQDLVIKEGYELSSRTYYTLALCASYKGQFDTALDYLNKALSISLTTNSKEDMCYALNGKVIVYRATDRYEDALKEIYNLEIFYQFLDLPNLKLSTRLENAHILSELKKYDQAIDVLWQAYDSAKTTKTISMHILLLLYLGRTYSLNGDKDQARIYLNLAWRMVDPENQKKLAKEIKAELENLGDKGLQNYDLVFDSDSNSVLERKLGRIDFKNQFILLDLLKLFVQNQGQVYSKEFLVEKVWKQSYEPEVHDNKIYVTIKRLRKLIEPDYDKPKYIFRAKNGYFMNKSAKILIEKTGELQ
jgi:DNA-binding winged helix-turn-helix (wHTH) protein